MNLPDAEEAARILFAELHGHRPYIGRYVDDQAFQTIRDFIQARDLAVRTDEDRRHDPPVERDCDAPPAPLRPATIPGSRITLARIVAELANGRSVTEFADDYDQDASSISGALRALALELEGRVVHLRPARLGRLCDEILARHRGQEEWTRRQAGDLLAEYQEAVFELLEASRITHPGTVMKKEGDDVDESCPFWEDGKHLFDATLERQPEGDIFRWVKKCACGHLVEVAANMRDQVASRSSYTRTRLPE